MKMTDDVTLEDRLAGRCRLPRLRGAVPVRRGLTSTAGRGWYSRRAAGTLDLGGGGIDQQPKKHKQRAGSGTLHRGASTRLCTDLRLV